MKKILIDCTLTGGRGPAKKAAEFIWECQRKKIPYFLLTDSSLVLTLNLLGINTDKVLEIDYSFTNEKIYSLFRKELNQISFDYLIKFGARTPGPFIAKEKKIRYIIVDGGLPDKYESYPSFFDKETYVNATKYIVTTNFPFKPIYPTFLKNIKICYFPISQKTRQYLTQLKQENKNALIKNISQFFTPFPKQYDLLINLNMTNDYVDETSRTTYGRWLTSKQYDQTVGFLRRLITDLGIQLNNKKIVVIADTKISQVCLDLYNRFLNIYPITWKKNWDYYTEIALDAISDITIARAANYQPFIFGLAKGNSITTAVPAYGYMNEDIASFQAMSLGLTNNILYDDDEYIKKMLLFYKNTKLQKKLAKNQENNFFSFGQEQNTINSIFKNLQIN